MTTDEPHSETIINCLRVLEMVAVLHRRGFERLRIEPGMSPSGMSWRCGITHADLMDPENGALCAESGGMVYYTSAMGDRLFDWAEAPRLDVEQLADRFLEDHEDLCESGRGDDPAYVDWYALMLSLARQGGLPYAYDDYGEDEPSDRIPTMGSTNGRLPLPPTGGRRA